jgi:hypothetical protein
MRLHLLDLAHPLLLADVVSDVDLLVVEQHVVDGLDGGVGGLGRLVVDESVSPGSTVLVNGDLAGEDVAEGGESVVEGLVVRGTRRNQLSVFRKNFHTFHGETTDLVVNLLVQVLDENVASRALPQGRVPLAPHDPARTPLDQAVVEAVEGSFAVGTVEVVDVGVSERTTGDGVSADSDAKRAER